MTIIEIKTQAELDKAIAGGATDVRFIKKGSFEIRCKNWLSVYVEAALKYDVDITAWESSQVTAWESSQVTAWESSQVTARESSQVTAWGSSQVTARESSQVTARGSSQVTARGSSQVTARGSSQVTAWESSQVTASGYVSISIFGRNVVKMSDKCHAFIHNALAKVTGGKTTKAILKTPKDWCDYYGVPVKNGIATVYKSVHADFFNPHNRTMAYTPGSKPEAPDWDGGVKECSGGIHVSPNVYAALKFYSASDAKYVSFGVKISEMAVHFDGYYPEKAKVKRVVTPIIQVDINGNPFVKKDAA